MHCASSIYVSVFRRHTILIIEVWRSLSISEEKKKRKKKKEKKKKGGGGGGRGEREKKT